LSSSNLGELQSSFETYTHAILSFENYLSNGFYVRKKKMLVTDLDNLKRMKANLSSQRTLQENDLALTNETFSANQTLKSQNVISDFEYRNEQSKLINKQLTIPQINGAIIINERDQNEKQKEMLELENTINQQKGIFLQALQTFKSEVQEWKRKFLLTAPTSGKVSYATILYENQQLKPGQTTCFINPENSSYFAQMVIPQYNLGKVKTGQTVLLRFPSYPSQEFGLVKGKIEFISRIPTDSGYFAKVSLPNGLKTNYKKDIQFRDGLIASGEIITKDLRLLERFYLNLLMK
jgi:hypothetical protein